MPLPIEVMSPGTWNGTKFTIEDLKEMAANFVKLKDVIKPPLKLGHTKDETGKPAFGWISDLKVIGSKLMAYADDIPELLMKAIKKKLYRRVSSEVFFDYVYDGKKYGRVFSGLALLGAETPAVKDLEDLQAYLTQNTDKGTFGKLMVFSMPENINNNSKRKEIMPLELKDLEKKLELFSDKLDTVSKENVSLKIENDKLKKEKTDSEAKAFEDLKVKSKGDLKSFCDDQVKAGKMLPAQRDALVGKICFSESGNVTIEFDEFKKFVELTGKILEKKEKVEDGKSGDEKFTDVQEEVDHLVTVYMREKKEEDYAAALNVVLEDKDLAKRYTGDFAIRKEA
jgi:regulator of replication initiation timing